MDVDHPANGSPEHVFTVDSDGRATIYRFADGRVLATGDLGIEPDRWEGTDPDRVAMGSVLGDRLYVLSVDGDRGTLTAYRLDTLARLWSATPVPRGRPEDCAGMLCVGGDAGVAVLNPADGSTRWTDRRWFTATTSVEGLILGVDADETTMALLDPATGRVIRSPGNGVVRGGLLLRSDSRAADRIWISDLVTGDVLGRRDDTTASGCVAAAEYLSCPTNHNTLDVWRLASG
jgi:outer membrane protein assembly factor BamB